MSRIGDIYIRANRFQDGLVWLKKAYPILKKIADNSTLDPAALSNYAGICNQIAEVEWRLGNEVDARKLYSTALQVRLDRRKIVDQWVKDGKAKESDQIQTLLGISTSYSYIGFSDLRSGDPASALKNYKLAESTLSELPAQAGAFLVTRRMKGEYWLRQADAHLRLGERKDAKALYEKAVKEYEDLVKATPKPAEINAALRMELATIYLYAGDFYIFGDTDGPSALGYYSRSEKLLSKLRQEDADNLEYERRFAALAYRKGIISLKYPSKFGLSGYMTTALEARTWMEQSEKLRGILAKIDPRDVSAQIEWMLALARLGRVDVANQIATNLEKLYQIDLQIQFQLLCAYSILAEQSPPVAQPGYLEKSITRMNMMKKVGWRDTRSLKGDPDLEFLRKDERYQKAIKELEDMAK